MTSQAEPGVPAGSERSQMVRALVDRAKEGDREAFGELYGIYVGEIFSIVLRQARRRELAEDITADTFERALLKIHTYQWRGSDFGAWLATIARRLVIDHSRLGQVKREVAGGLGVGQAAADEHSPEDIALDHMRSSVVRQALGELAAEQQESIYLRYFAGLSVAETAQKLGKSEGAVKALTYRARQCLARLQPIQDLQQP